MPSAYCQFDPLKEVWLGDVYPNEFYDELNHIKNKEALKIINVALKQALTVFITGD